MGRFATALGRRVLVALVIFAVILVLAFALPRLLPGEIPAARLAVPPAGACGGCRSEDRLVGAGAMAEAGAWYVNVRFAAPPDTVALRLEFDRAGFLDVERRDGSWRQRDATGGPRLTGVAERGALVIFTVSPAGASGLAAIGPSNSRAPADGFAQPLSPPRPSFNLVDVVILGLLALSAYRGLRREPAAELTDLVIILGSFAIAILLSRPFAASFEGLGVPPMAAIALGGGLVVLAVVIAGFVAAPRIAPPIARIVRGVPPDIARSGGSVLAAARQLPMLALILLLIVDLLLLAWISPAIRESLIGSGLLNLGRGIFG